MVIILVSKVQLVGSDWVLFLYLQYLIWFLICGGYLVNVYGVDE